MNKNTAVDTTKKPQLPSIQELYADSEKAFKDDTVLTLLNQTPPEKWVKEHPYIKGYKYLPIDKVEYLLKRIFKKYKIEVLKTGMLLNTVEVTIRVWYADILTGEWLHHDGVGAQELQTQKDSGNLKLDMSNINRGAISMALPIAKSMAIKDACDHFGTLFGADLNRKDTMSFTPDTKLSDIVAKKEYDRIVGYITIAATKEELEVLYTQLPEQYHHLITDKINGLQ